MSNPQFSKAIQKSFANQTITLAKTVENDSKVLTFECIYCNMAMVEVQGEYDCPHCGGMMREDEECDMECDEECHQGSKA